MLSSRDIKDVGVAAVEYGNIISFENRKTNLASLSMKQREPRRKVLIKARMRYGSVWRDVCVRNVSSRGMMLQSSITPARGHYIEVHRGRHIIVGRVVWQKNQTFGVQTQSRIDLDALIQEPDLSGTSFSRAIEADKSFERRRTARAPIQQAERSRQLGARLEFCALLAFGLSAAVCSAPLAVSILAAPLQAVSAALKPLP